MNHIDQIRERIENPVKVSVLTEDIMWRRHTDELIWQADRFEGEPHFNSVYQWKDYYSYSLLALIVKKGNLAVDQNAYKKAKREDFLSLYANEMIDRDIKKVGGPAYSDLSITDPDDYMQKVAAAMKADLAQVEDDNPGYVHLVLTGGKDSLNSLLLPYKNPVIALSADPNYRLTCEFVERNNLDIEVRRLEDPFDSDLLEREILECCCRMELSNWKWGAALKATAEEFDNKVIFWQGQYSEIILSTDWKHMIWPKNWFNNFRGKIHRITSPFMPPFIRYWVGTRAVNSCATRAWHFTSVKLGDHMAFIRALCSALVLSPYMGPNMMKLYTSVNQARAVQYDRRHEVGPAITGRDIWYPDENPGPPISKFRYKKQDPDLFIKALEEGGITIC